MRQLLPHHVELPLEDVYAGLTLGGVSLPTGRSWVALGMVSSLDGAAAVAGTSGGLGGEADRVAFRRLRSACDVILVGAGTVSAESYRPPRSSPERAADRRDRGLEPDPALAIVTAGLSLEPSHRVFSDPEHRPIVITRGGHDAARLREMSQVADVAEVGTDEIDLAGALDRLRARGLVRVLCEGGPQLASGLLRLGLIDEVFVTLAPTLVGGEAPRIVHGDETSYGYVLTQVHEHEGELLLRYARA